MRFLTNLLNKSVLLVMATVFCVSTLLAQFSTTAPPKDCGRYSTYSWGSGGYSCVKDIVWAQFSVQQLQDGAQWTSQVNALLPDLPLYNGQVKGVQFVVTPGYYAQGPFPVGKGLATLAESGRGAHQSFPTVIESNHGATFNFTGAGNCEGSCKAVPGTAQGPMFGTVFAPDLETLTALTSQLTYFYTDANGNDWQITVQSVDSQDAKPKWYAPYFQGGEKKYVTAFAVVNMGKIPQTVSVSIVDEATGTYLAGPKSTQLLEPGITDPRATTETMPGGFATMTVDAFFNGNAPSGQGRIQFEADQGQPILVLILRAVGKSVGSVPVK